MNEVVSVAVRSVAVYLFIILAIRVFGKKEIAQLSVVDLVFILLISNSVQNAMVGNNSTLVGGLVAASALFIVNSAFKYLFFKSEKLSTLFQGKPIVLIYKGNVVQEHMDQAKITQEELDATIHEHGVEKVSQVDLAILEADGNISVLSKNFTHQTTRKRRGHRAINRYST